MKTTIVTMLVLTALLVSGFGIYFYLGNVEAPPPIQGVIVEKPFIRTISTQLKDYPIIPGGIHNLQDLLNIIAKRPALYEGIDIKSLRVLIVPQDFWAYVQYSRDGKTFWTKKRVLIRKGETLYIDDFGRWIRGQCGNELSSGPAHPTSSNEPQDIPINSELSIEPPELPTSLIEIDNIPTPASPGPSQSSPPNSYYPIYPIVPIGCCGSPRPVPVSEPNSIYLLCLGLSCIFLLTKKQ